MGRCSSWWSHGLCVLVSSIVKLSIRGLTETDAVLRTLQFFVSPRIGALSDKYGRKRILLITMIGNILSALMYVHPMDVYQTV